MKILFDNYNYGSACKSLWGFSIYLEKYSLLFDTGSNGRYLLHNIKELNIDIKEIKYIFITHAHWDHIGGLDSILELNSDLTLFVPSSLPKHLLIDLQTMVKNVIICNDEPQELLPGIFTTGTLGNKTREQALIIKDNYPKLITGCGHFGISKIVKKASEVINEDIKMAIGGFHHIDKDKSVIMEAIKTLKLLGVKKVVPTHCTGDYAIELYSEHFKENYIQGGVGKVICLEHS